MKLLSRLDENFLRGRSCLLRINLDIKEPNEKNWRLQAVVPTIKYLLEHGSKIKILSHRGRPEGEDKELLLAPVMKILSKIVGQELDYLENVRFNSLEHKNDHQFAEELAKNGDFYVNDDFATSHRPHTSISAITSHLPSFAGLLLEKEVEVLTRVRDHPSQPLVIIIGGIKIADKAAAIDYLYDKTEAFLMGSAYIDQEDPTLQKEKVIIPSDWSTDNSHERDIGPQTIQQYQEVISGAKTIIWSGPVGLIELPKFRNGSKAVAEAITKTDSFAIAGGGDTSRFLIEEGVADMFDFISTGGGAMLDFLANKELPGLEALKK